MEKSINRKCIKIRLIRPLSAQEVWNKLIGIEIQALESLLEQKSLDKWKTIFPCYGTSLESAEFLAKSYIETFKDLQGNVYNENPEYIEGILVKSLSTNWFNTIMSTLFMMEEDLLSTSADSVFEIWDLLFTCQALREENHVVAMGLNTFKLK